MLQELPNLNGMKNNRPFIHRTLLILTGLLVITACRNEAPSDGYTVSGTVKGLDTGWVKLLQPNIVDRSKTRVIDSTRIENGAFEFTGKVDHVDMVDLVITDKYRTDFFLDNNEISLEIDLTKANEYGGFDPVVSGSEYQEEYEKQMAEHQALFHDKKYDPLVAFNEQMQKAYREKDTALIEQYKKKGDSLRELSNERQEAYQGAKIDYVREHPNSPVAPYVMGFQFSEGRMSEEQMKEIFPLFEGEAKKTAMYQYYADIYDDIFNSMGVGGTVPDFTLTTVSGEPLTLSEVDAKYLLVDFWASWCVPCRASFPHLKELYSKYNKEGFEVVGIGTADEEQEWRKAIKEDQTPWKHVFDSGENHMYGEVAKAYGVPFLPTTFLIDNKRTILLRNPSKSELDNKLAELFGY